MNICSVRTFLFTLIFLTNVVESFNKKPRLTVIMVVDQCAYNYLPKLSPYLKNGIKFLMQHGIVYENAYYPHAMPSTAPGHTDLAAGITADYTGIVGNNWIDQAGNKVAADDDDPQEAAVINPRGGLYDYGKGPRNIMVDNLSDQYALSQEPNMPRVAISLSLKSRSAICTANKLGKAIWFDATTGNFTSSRAYYEKLPNWLVSFNQQKRLQNLKSITWPLYYPRNSAAYNFKHIDNYKYSAHAPIAGKTVSVDWNSEVPFLMYEHTPAANQLLFDLAVRCVKTHVSRTSCQEMLLWVCLSPLDLIGHDYGPYSREAIDMIYHLDCQIAQFMDTLSCYLKRTDVLYVLTADHGVSPIPEIMNEDGYEPAVRIRYENLIGTLNKRIENKFGVRDLLTDCSSCQLYLDQSAFGQLDPKKQKHITAFVQQELKKQPGIKRVWTPEELDKTWYEPYQIESFYKNQVYPGRTGHFIIQPFPYCILDNFDKGTGHRTPYEPDTHVPLIMYQKHNLEKRVIYEKVWTLQLANSLAFILGIQKPSASTYNILPGLIDYDPITGEVIQTIAL